MRLKNVTHIPFGRRKSDQRLVDVAEVKRGAKCGCICPSCDGALIARQGKINAWHFAHASDGQSSRACHYSFFVSLRHMLLQLARDGATFTTPHLSGKARLHSATRYFEVARSTRLSFDSVDCDTRFEEVSVDIVAQIADTPLVIYIRHPGRKVPAALSLRRERRAGIIAFDLSKLSDFRWSTAAGSGTTARNALKRAFEIETAGKKWLYHPRYQREHDHALKEMERTMALRRPKIPARARAQDKQPKPDSPVQPADAFTPAPAPLVRQVSTIPFGVMKSAEQAPADPPTPPMLTEKVGKRPANPPPEYAFSCVMCESTWNGLLPQNYRCSECQTHLFVTYALLEPGAKE